MNFLKGMIPAWMLLVSGIGQAAALEPPVVRIDIHPETVTVGEAVELRLTVLGPTWFPTPPVFPSLEVPNAVVRLPSDSSGPTSAQVNGERWSGVTRRYEVFPMLSASYRLGGGSMRVTVADPGAESQIFDVAVPDVRLRAAVPDGAQDLDPYIAGVKFRIWRELEGEIGDLEPGDGLVVRYFAELDGMPAIFLPSLTPQIDTDIATVYADEPVLRETDVARRVERTTLVMKQGGALSLPAVTLRWWNRAMNRVEEVSVEALTIPVNGPSLAVDGAQLGRVADWRLFIVALLVLAVIVYLVARFLPRLRHRLAERRAARLRSEQYAFARFEQACRRGEQGAVYATLIAWQKKLCPDLELVQFADAYGDRTLQMRIAVLSESLYGGTDGKTDSGVADLRRAAKAARVRFLNDRNRAPRQLIPELNPR